MSSPWFETLGAAGARFEDATVLHFGDPDGELAAAAAGDDTVTPLSHYGVIAATGSDAATLLQGQFTTDLRDVKPACSRLGAMCSPKGRILVNARIVAHGGGYLLVMPVELLAGALKRLRMYVLRADVQLEDATEEWAVIGLHGAGVMAAAGVPGEALTAEVNESMTAGDGVAVRLHGARVPRCLLLAPRHTAPALFTAAAAVGRPAGREAWDLTEVEAAVPQIVAATQDAFVPQMVNLQALGGVSFTKGCYAGQEVVARMQYLGTLKRRMYRARAAVDEAPAPGTPLYAPQSPGGQSVGKVVSAARLPGGGSELLAVLQIKSAEEDSIHLEGPDGPRLDMLDLPYSLDA